jgi:hypothetical protein
MPPSMAPLSRQFVVAMGENQPPGYVLDVAGDAKGNRAVIEANAAWHGCLMIRSRPGIRPLLTGGPLQ